MSRTMGRMLLLVLLAAAVAPAQVKERMDAEPELPRPMPGIWVEQETTEARPVFEEDTSTAAVWDTGFSFISIQVDSVPIRIHVDGRQFVQVESVMVVRVAPGRHHVSYFPLYRVQLAFRREIPSPYWQLVGRHARLAGDYDLISAHDASAVREGTHWVTPVRGDTARVTLSWHKAQTAFARTGRRTAMAVFGITTAIAIAMVISEALVEN